MTDNHNGTVTMTRQVGVADDDVPGSVRTALCRGRSRRSIRWCCSRHSIYAPPKHRYWPKCRPPCIGMMCRSTDQSRHHRPIDSSRSTTDTTTTVGTPRPHDRRHPARGFKSTDADSAPRSSRSAAGSAVRHSTSGHLDLVRRRLIAADHAISGGGSASLPVGSMAGPGGDRVRNPRRRRRWDLRTWRMQFGVQ